MRVKEHPESKAEQDGRRFSFARALQGIARAKKEMNFPPMESIGKRNYE